MSNSPALRLPFPLSPKQVQASCPVNSGLQHSLVNAHVHQGQVSTTGHVLHDAVPEAMSQACQVVVRLVALACLDLQGTRE